MALSGQRQTHNATSADSCQFLLTEMSARLFLKKFPAEISGGNLDSYHTIVELRCQVLGAGLHDPCACVL